MAISGLLERFKKGLAKTAQLFNIRSWFGRKVDQSFLDDLESRLIQADVGVAATTRIIDRVREAYAEKTADENLLRFVKAELKGLLEDPRPGTLLVAPKPPSVYLIAGVNGSGKTTSIAKLAQHLKDQGRRSSWPLATHSAPRRPTSFRSGPLAPAARSSRERPGLIRPAWPTMPASGHWPAISTS